MVRTVDPSDYAPAASSPRNASRLLDEAIQAGDGAFNGDRQTAKALINQGVDPKVAAKSVGGVTYGGFTGGMPSDHYGTNPDHNNSNGQTNVTDGDGDGTVNVPGPVDTVDPSDYADSASSPRNASQLLDQALQAASGTFRGSRQTAKALINQGVDPKVAAKSVGGVTFGSAGGVGDAGDRHEGLFGGGTGQNNNPNDTDDDGVPDDLDPNPGRGDSPNTNPDPPTPDPPNTPDQSGMMGFNISPVALVVGLVGLVVAGVGVVAGGED